jgi:hypothetical protein
MSQPPLHRARCARCARALYYVPGSIGHLGQFPVFYCRGCQAVVDREQAAIPCVRGARCVHASYQGGPFSGLVVKAVDGRFVTVTVPDCPGDDVLARCWPPAMHGRRIFYRHELLMRRP